MWGIIVMGAIVAVGVIVGSAFDSADKLGRDVGGELHNAYGPAFNIEMPSDIATMTEEECRMLHGCLIIGWHVNIATRRCE